MSYLIVEDFAYSNLGLILIASSSQVELYVFFFQK
jgi:hypothetical protein